MKNKTKDYKSGKANSKASYANGKRSRKPKNDVSDNMDSKDNGRTLPNNPYWYGATPELIRDTASLSYGYPLGRPIDFKNPDATQSVYAAFGKYSVMPGVMAFKIVPSIGYSDSTSSPANVASRNLYSWTRHANSGHNNYDAPDEMLYLLGMDSLYSVYAWGCRIYGLLRQYNHVNRYWPRAILLTEHIDYDDFLANMSNFRAFLDMFAKKVGSMCVPAVMPYFDRHVQIYSQVYLDSPVLKAQMYVYTPYQFFEYDELSGAGQLVAAPVPYEANNHSHNMTYAEFVAYANNLIEKILASEDMNIMSGDILKAFGESKLIKLNYVPIDYETPILYSPEMLMQIQNLTVMSYDLPAITQDVNTGALICTPSRTTKPVLDAVRILTMTKEDVTPLETIVATRLTTVPKAGPGGTYHPSSTGSEYVTAVTIGYFNYLYQFTDVTLVDSDIPINLSMPMLVASQIHILSLIEKFNQHPVFTVSQSTGEICAHLEDVDNYTLIEAEEIDEMNEAALLSMFNVPQLGMWTASSELNKS